MGEAVSEVLDDFGRAAVTGLSAGPANAQAGTFAWSGEVDHTTRVEIRGRSVNSYAVDGKSPRNVNYRVGGAAFEAGSNIRLQMVDGRGQARTCAGCLAR